MENVTPRERCAQIAEGMVQETEVEVLTSELVRLGPRRLVEEAVAAEVTERLELDRYERRSDGAEGGRNGYKERRVGTAGCRIGVQVP